MCIKKIYKFAFNLPHDIDDIKHEDGKRILWAILDFVIPFLALLLMYGVTTFKDTEDSSSFITMIILGIIDIALLIKAVCCVINNFFVFTSSIQNLRYGSDRVLNTACLVLSIIHFAATIYAVTWVIDLFQIK